MAMRTGWEVGLPKKLCEPIVVERNDTYAHAFIGSKGRRIFEVDVEVEAGDEGQAGRRETSTCITFTYEQAQATDGRAIFPRVQLIGFESAMEYHKKEFARIESIKMEPSLDAPWAELSVVKPLTARYAVCCNPVLSHSPIKQFEGDEADRLFSYLFAGRFDRSTICAGHQRYGQF